MTLLIVPPAIAASTEPGFDLPARKTGERPDPLADRVPAPGSSPGPRATPRPGRRLSSNPCTALWALPAGDLNAINRTAIIDLMKEADMLGRWVVVGGEWVGGGLWSLMGERVGR